jgi:hypothetical protein
VKQYLPWIFVGLLALALAAALPFVISSLSKTPSRPNVIRAAILSPESVSFLPRNQFAVSPDGSRLTFVARAAAGQQQLWVRTLGTLTSQPLAGTDDATYPFWSADSRYIGFFAQGKLKKIDASGGPAQTLCDAPAGRGGTWNRNGDIVFAPNNFGPLYRMSSSGGAPAVVTKLDDAKLQATHSWPWFLPDGRHFLYRSGTSSGASEKESNGIYLGSLESLQEQLILRTDTNPVYASGYLLFVRDGTLMAQGFDENNLQLTGDAVPVAEHVQFDYSLARAAFSVSDNGILISQSGAPLANRELVWFDRNGKQSGTVGEPALYAQMVLSPDNQKVAMAIFDLQVGSTDIWFYVLSGLRMEATSSSPQTQKAATIFFKRPRLVRVMQN